MTYIAPAALPTPTPSSPVTTRLGGGAIGTALVGIITMFMSGHIDINPLIADIGVLIAGVSAIFSKDWNAHGGTKTT